ncbi:MAG: hypothetical protein ABW217_20215, partial [Polyangiaceae bacterium]
MSQLDDELEHALREGEKKDGAAGVAPTEVASPVVSDSPPEESSRRGWMLLGGLGVIMAGILALFFTSSKDAVTYA